MLEDFGGDLSLPDNFKQTVPVYDPASSGKKSHRQPDPQVNEQTALLCTMLDLTGRQHRLFMMIVLYHDQIKC